MASSFLKNMNVKILNRNFRCKIGEIDIIFRDKEYLVFGEVKYRNENHYGSPEEAVNVAKQKKICRVSDYYRMINGISEFTAVRFDVLAINGNEIKWIKDAFPYRYK